MLKIQILIKNNEKTIKDCLDSLSPIKGQIEIIDIGCVDKTPEICLKYGLKPIKKSLSHNYSKVRNNQLNGDFSWFMWIEPWEKIIQGHDEINLIISQQDFKKCFDFKIIENSIILKETKLWNTALNLQFQNNVFETINYPNSIEADGVILHKLPHTIDLEEKSGIINFWKKTSPLASEPSYYEANLMLTSGKYLEFCNCADYYLFQNKTNNIGDMMMRYHLAMIQIYKTNKINDGIQNTLRCILEKPTMAEFWCLLGDAYYKIKDYQKAIAFYENAIIIGQRRNDKDNWPLDITKYKQHPEKMIASCQKIIDETIYFKGK